jgi:acetyl esterase/lipase
LDEVRDLHQALGSSIRAIIQPTAFILIPRLLKAIEKIQAIPRTTEQYGSHPRQNLDIYQPAEDVVDAPILIFLHGGGFTQGDKILRSVPYGLVYHNLGAFFATRGFTTIIPDYRRVNSDIGGEDAKYPSGGEDLSLVLKWLEESVLLRDRKRDAFIMGESAGGVHVATFLFNEEFLEQRRGLIDGNKVSRIVYL